MISQFAQNIYVQLKNLFEFFQKIVWLIGFVVTIREILSVRIWKEPAELTS